MDILRWVSSWKIFEINMILPSISDLMGQKGDFWSENVDSKSTVQVGLKFDWNILAGVQITNFSLHDNITSGCDMQIRYRKCVLLVKNL